MPIFIQMILIFILALNLYCSKKEKDGLELKKIDTRELIGTWKIIPSGGERILFEPQSKAKIIRKDGGETLVYLRADSEGMRLVDSEDSTVPLGYFLFMERKENVWAGVYKRQLVRLEKEVTPKKSILE